MALNRRLLLQSIPAGIAAGALSFPARSALGQSRTSTPEATPAEAFETSGSVEEALLGIAPDKILLALLTSEVTTRLFPSDTGEVRAVPWVNESDTDLIGTIGGVIMETSRDEHGNSIGPGVFIVYPDPEAALERLDDYRAEAETQMNDPAAEVMSEVVSIEMAGYPGITIREPDNAYSVVVVGPVIAGGQGDPNLPGDAAFRSLANCAALLDHLRTVVQAPA